MFNESETQLPLNQMFVFREWKSARPTSQAHHEARRGSKERERGWVMFVAGCAMTALLHERKCQKVETNQTLNLSARKVGEAEPPRSQDEKAGAHRAVHRRPNALLPEPREGDATNKR